MSRSMKVLNLVISGIPSIQKILKENAGVEEF